LKFIQTATREQAEDILKELEGGKNYDKLTDKLIEDGKATVKGYNWTSPTFFRPGIADALKEIREGEFDGPFKSETGYFIFRVKERKHERAKSLEEASDEIRAMLNQQRGKAAVAHWLAERRKTADIVIYY
jgi:peptidyl-prolyl cis-trans isomerase SurA